MKQVIHYGMLTFTANFKDNQRSETPVKLNIYYYLIQNRSVLSTYASKSHTVFVCFVRHNYQVHNKLL